MLRLIALGTLAPSLFFPASLIIVGAHYLTFISLYGMRLYGVLAGVLVLPLARLQTAFHINGTALLQVFAGDFRQAAEDGMDMGEVMNLPLPADLAGLGVARAEYQRSVGHLYPAYEQQALSHPRKRP